MRIENINKAGACTPSTILVAKKIQSTSTAIIGITLPANNSHAKYKEMTKSKKSRFALQYRSWVWDVEFAGKGSRYAG